MSQLMLAMRMHEIMIATARTSTPWPAISIQWRECSMVLSRDAGARSRLMFLFSSRGAVTVFGFLSTSARAGIVTAHLAGSRTLRGATRTGQLHNLVSPATLTKQIRHGFHRGVDMFEERLVAGA